ncbi:hypothetical protein CVV43_00190 [Candidatus Saccharibacteria bacterium HGW-Saccharibacteria-1]|nr:MAG: hypothetical protein CVV43_00190 [Candidatus Saccharibacteria bacterium HGW-Saccharibacteria-1]
MVKNTVKKLGQTKVTKIFSCLLFISILVSGIATISLIATTSVKAVTYISQSYATTEKLSLGSLVSLKNNSSDEVIAADTNSVDNLLGVVISSTNSLMSLSSGGNNQVQVATTGTIQVLVSDVNGAITRGSQITASQISGVGMKATNNTRVIGISQGDLASSSTKSETYTDKTGVKHTVKLGQVPVLVNVSYFFKEPDKTIIPAAIQNVANAVAGKSVSTLPILVSAAIFIVTLIVVVSIIFAMINSSIISVGRNPMSQSAIYRDIVQLSALVLAILAVGLISIYLVLTRL